jgi:peptidoglycan hydrolase-like protein with peptidoglycan-binding domain
MELGYMDPDETTQYYGPLTKSSLRTFQLHNGLVHDGICGEQTYTLLMSKDAKIYVMQEGDSGVDVEEVQHRLYELGYLDNKANITGKFGEKTTEAAKMFQKKSVSLKMLTNKSNSTRLPLTHWAKNWTTSAKPSCLKSR